MRPKLILRLGMIMIIGISYYCRFNFQLFYFSNNRRIKTSSPQEWIGEWVEAQDVLLIRPKEYLQFLNAVREEINPYGEPGKIVYYPGIGPHGIFLDLVTPLLSTDCDVIVGVDVGRGIIPKMGIDLDSFKLWVTSSLEPLITRGIISPQEMEFREEEDNKFICSFPFRGRKRMLIIYYEKDAGKFFPPELENGYDVLITRWVPLGMPIDSSVAEEWLQKMNTPGYIITSGDESWKGGDCDLILPAGFWDNFTLVSQDFLSSPPRRIFFLKRR